MLSKHESSFHWMTPWMESELSSNHFLKSYLWTLLHWDPPLTPSFGRTFHIQSITGSIVSLPQSRLCQKARCLEEWLPHCPDSYMIMTSEQPIFAAWSPSQV
jgi:hypothetical protein